jgi:hypothetical protein
LEEISMSDTERYIDPNSGAAPQPGGYAASRAPVIDQGDGLSDAAVADEVTEEQAKAEGTDEEAAGSAKKPVRGAHPSSRKS